MVPQVLRHLFEGAPPATCLLVVDGTVGLGGHARAILSSRPEVRVLGLDRDPEALARAAQALQAFGDRQRLVHASYADVPSVLARLGEDQVWGVLLDLGVSSLQLDDPTRGFSFREGRAGADMRFDPTGSDPTALELVNQLAEGELSRILWEHGSEPRARAVARALVRARPLNSGEALADVVRRHAYRTRRHDPATRTFQALRIAVNDELGHLARGLEAALATTCDGGRIVVISFHSGEDRLVKHAFRDAARKGLGVLRTKKPERPSEEEVGENRRARPARLRAFERRLEGQGRG